MLQDQKDFDLPDNFIEKISFVRNINGITSTQKLILLIIASHLGNNDFAFLSLTTLQNECSIKKRTAITENIEILESIGILTVIKPSDGYRSNRYTINYEKITAFHKPKRQSPKVTSNLQSLVTVGYQPSNLQSLDQSPTVTRLVTDGYPKRNINNNEKKNKEQQQPKNPVTYVDNFSNNEEIEFDESEIGGKLFWE